MKHRTLARALLLVLPVSTLVVACGKDEDTDARAVLEREALERDLELALEPDTTAQPALTDVALTAEPEAAPLPAPVAAPPRREPAPDVQRRTTPPPAPRATPRATQPRREAPAREPARDEGRAQEPQAPRQVTRSAPSGTRFSVRMNEQLSTRSASVGESFTATLTQPILSGDGDVVIPAGATVRGRVTESTRAGRAGEKANLRIAFTSISYEGRSYPIDASIVGTVPVRTVTADSRKEQAGKVAGGAAAGAVLGQIIGKNTKSTIAGAAIGAAAGTAVAIGTADVDAVISEGATMQVELDGPVRVTRDG